MAFNTLQSTLIRVYLFDLGANSTNVIIIPYACESVHAHVHAATRQQQSFLCEPSKNGHFVTLVLVCYCMRAWLMVFPHSLVIRITQLFQMVFFLCPLPLSLLLPSIHESSLAACLATVCVCECECVYCLKNYTRESVLTVDRIILFHVLVGCCFSLYYLLLMINTASRQLYLHIA